MIQKIAHKRGRPQKKVISFTILFSLLFVINSFAQQKVVFSEWFYTPDNDISQCTAWNDFGDQLSPDKRYKSVLFKGSENETGLFLDDPVAVTELASAVHTNQPTTFTANGQFWRVHVYEGNSWVSASSLGNSFPAEDCINGPEFFAVRACLENGNFGGISGFTCDPPSQRIDLIFTYAGVSLVDNVPATCPESSDGSLTAQMHGGKAPYTFSWSNGVTTTSGDAISGYTLLGHFEESSYYRSDAQAATMDAAQADAETNFGYVVSINSAEENAWLIANGVQAGDNLGGTDRDEEGIWKWASGEAFSYTNWAVGEPNNGGGAGQSNMQMYANGTWDDVMWAQGVNVRHIVELPGISKIENLEPGEYTVTVTDADGEVTTSTFTVGPETIEISFAMTQSGTCGETGNGGLEALVSGGTAPYSFVWSSGETDATISNKSIGEYTVTITDANNCASVQASGTITANDITDPIALVKAADIYLDADGLATVSATDINDGSTDDCDIDSMYVSNPDFDCSDAGTPGLSATLVVVDFSGNYASAEANINLIDTIKPLAIVKNIIAQLNGEGVVVISADDADDGSTDNCSIASRALNITDFSCDDLGEHEVIMTVTDASGNESEAVFTVTVVDQVAPIMPAIVTMNVYLGEDGTVLFDSAPLLAAASDNCGLDAIVALGPNNQYIDVNGYPVSCNEVGNTQVPLFVRDNSGNLTAFTLAATVIDTIKPSFNLDFIELEIDANGNAFLTQAMLMPYASDNCAIAEVAIQIGNFDCSKIGAPQYTEILVYDMNGNYKQQTLEVQVIDIIVPTVQVNDITLALNENGEAVLSVDLLEMIADDNCTPTNFVFSQNTFSCADIGTTSVNITVADAAGNTGGTTFMVTIVDDTAPEIMAPEIIQVCYGEQVSYAGIAAMDNCSAQLAMIAGPQAGTTPELGDYLVEFEAVDPSGNATTKLVLLEVSARAEVYLGEDRVVESGSMVTLVAGQNAANRYLWSNGSTAMIYQFTASENVTVSVTVTTPAGCSATDEINISIANTVGIDEDTAGNSVRFYPNPTLGQMSIALSLTKVATDVRMNITDITGKSVLQRVIPMAKDGDVLSLDLSAFADGIYLVNLQSDSFNLTERVVKH